MNIFNWPEWQFVAFFFVLVRVTSLMMLLPIFGDRAIPANVKILFGLAYSFVAFPMLMGQGLSLSPSLLASGSQTLWGVACELGFGMMLAFVARWIFDAVQFAGHFAGTSIGFSMASVLDPHTESQTIALAELHYVLAGLLFLGMDGHHIFLAAILKSFSIVPLGGANFAAHGDAVVQYLIAMTSEVLLLGVKLAAPVMVVSLIVNLTFGVLTRAVPQLNVMAVSFTANIVVGLFVVIVSLSGFVNMVNGAFDVYMPELLRFMRLFQ